MARDDLLNPDINAEKDVEGALEAPLMFLITLRTAVLLKTGSCGRYSCCSVPRSLTKRGKE